MLELVDRHDSGSCVRKGVGVRVSPGARSKNLGARMKIGFLNLCLLFVLTLILVNVTGCERRPKNYAGVSKDDPNIHYTVPVDPQR